MALLITVTIQHKKKLLLLSKCSRPIVLLKHLLQLLQDLLLLSMEVGHIAETLNFLLDAIDVHTKSQGKLAGNYVGPSNQMEAVAFTQMFVRLQKNPNIIEVVKDDDVKINLIIDRSNWTVDILSDTNHIIKNFETIFNKYNKKACGKLRGLQQRLKDFLRSVLSEESTTIQKIEKFQNCIQHYCGNHERCPNHGKSYDWPHANDKKAVIILTDLVTELLKIIEHNNSTKTTNYCENFHSIKSRMCNKAFHWGPGWIGRVVCAILQYNEPDSWVLTALKLCNCTTMPPYILFRFLARMAERKKMKIKRSSNDFKRKRNLSKSAKRKQDTSDTKIKNDLAHK